MLFYFHCSSRSIIITQIVREVCSLDDGFGSSYDDPAVPVSHASKESTATPPVSPVPVTSTSVSNLTSVTHATVPAPCTIPLTTTPPIIPHAIPSSSESSPVNCSCDVKSVVENMFPDVDISKVHHFDLCQEKSHCHLTGSKFKHEWLC